MMENKPVLCVVAGPNGSGKTTLTQILLPYSREHWQIQEYINPDEIAWKQFGGYTAEAHLKAAVVAQALREQYILRRTPFLFETVLSTVEKVAFIERAQAQGFFVRMFFIATEDPVINTARIGSRVKAGAHDVPAYKTIARYERSLVNLVRCIFLCDYICVFDNSYDNQAPQKIFRTSKGRLVKHYAQPDMTPQWCHDVLDALSRHCHPHTT